MVIERNETEIALDWLRWVFCRRQIEDANLARMLERSVIILIMHINCYTGDLWRTYKILAMWYKSIIKSEGAVTTNVRNRKIFMP